MITVLGLVVMLASVLAGFILSGTLAALPLHRELLLAGGAALGTLAVAAPGALGGRLVHAIRRAWSPSLPTRADYLDLLRLQFELFLFARRNGAIALEPHVEELERSDIFSCHADFLGRHDAVEFFRDALRQLVNGTHADELELLLEAMVETHQEEAHVPVGLLKATGDLLPGLGIIAAVLGIVVTLTHVHGAAEIGRHVGAALVGTFVGMLLRYGLLQPLATSLELRARAGGRYLRCIKEGVTAVARGASPLFAVEFARKAIFSEERPSCEEMERACAAVKAGA